MSKIRLLDKSDLPAIDEIYCQAIDAKFSTAHKVPLSGEAWLEWFHEHEPASYPVYVWEEEGRLAGWVSLGPYRKGCSALRSTAEISYYVHSHFFRMGIASRLMKHAIRSCPDLGIKTLIAIIMEPNTASSALLKKFSFELWGDMPGILEVEGGNYNHQYWGLYVS